MELPTDSPSITVPSGLRRAAGRLSPRRVVALLKAALPEGHAIASEVWERRHRGLVILLWLHVAGIPVFSLVTGHSLGHSALEASIVAVGAVVAQWGPRNRRFLSVAATMGLVASSAVLVHLSGGFVEFHFHYFFTLAAVSLYHDWAPFLTAVGFVVVQHGVVGALDPGAVYNHPDAIAHPWKWAGIHALFVLAASAVSLVRWKSSEVEALKDPLTLLPNRALFGDRLRQALVRHRFSDRTVAVLFLDVDDFKSINDTAGHAAGDRLLVVVADRLREALRSVDTVARLGGDEFAIVLEEVTSVPEAAEVAERILEALRAPLAFEGSALSVSVSIGLAVRTDDSIGDAELVRNADIAMYVAKKSGKGCYALFEPSMHEAVLERTALAQDLEGAVARGELRVLYQPIKELASDHVAGFEALMRWEHPRLGTLAPARFIAIAEETGLIVELGMWIMRTACAQAKEWDQIGGGRSHWVSVNVAARQLARPSFVDEVFQILQETKFEPDRLVLEITENAMVVEDAAMISRLHLLKAIGVRLALDDFGTGYSSLSYLRRLPIDILKIDKTFIDGTDQGPEESALARAILKIADGMGIACVAEGVEREAQAAELGAAGCAFGQGYLFGVPVDAGRVAALLQWAPGARRSRGTILVVGGIKGSSDLVHRGLRSGGFATVRGSSAADVMHSLRTRPGIDLVLLDLPLADEHSMRIVGEMRDDPMLARIPILVLRGPDVASDCQFSQLHPSADAHLAKPYGEQELLINVRELVGASAAP